MSTDTDKQQDRVLGGGGEGEGEEEYQLREVTGTTHTSWVEPFLKTVTVHRGDRQFMY
jgi:hypothetical protein